MNFTCMNPYIYSIYKDVHTDTDMNLYTDSTYNKITIKCTTVDYRRRKDKEEVNWKIQQRNKTKWAP